MKNLKKVKVKEKDTGSNLIDTEKMTMRCVSCNVKIKIKEAKHGGLCIDCWEYKKYNKIPERNIKETNLYIRKKISKKWI